MRVSWLCVRVHVPGGHARRLGKLLLHALAMRQPPRPRHPRPRRGGLVRCPAPAPLRRAPLHRGGLVRRPAPAPLRRVVGSVRPLAVPVVEGQLRGEIGPNGDQRPMRAGGRRSIPPIGCARVGPPGIERCGRQVGSCGVQERDVEPGVSGVSDFTGRRTPR